MGKEGGHRKGSPGIDTHYFCSESMNENQAHMCTEMQRKLGTVAPSSKSILWMDGGYEIISAKVAKYINNIIYILYMYAQHIYIFFFFLVFLGPHPQHMEVLRLGAKSQLQLEG